MQDVFGSVHSTASQAALEAFEAAVWAIIRHQPDVAGALDRARLADPDMPAVHAVKGLALVTLARGDMKDAILQSQRRTHLALSMRDGGTMFERTLALALTSAADGRLLAASEILTTYLENEPHALHAAKLAYGLKFMSGDHPGMLALTTRLLPEWQRTQAGFGYLLGCHAFALEEAGFYEEAEETGLAAMTHAPDDAWGLHAVSHIYEMRHEVEKGIAWINTRRPVWTRCNNFSLHVAWHLALFHLERRDHAQVLNLYDQEIMPRPSDDFRDVANAASLLWRLEQSGVTVGRERWNALAESAAGRVYDATLVFASLHSLLALIGARRFAEARQLVDSMAVQPLAASSDQQQVAAVVGHDLASGILACAEGRTLKVTLLGLANRLQRIGGSAAQRDIFLRSLVVVAETFGDRQSLHEITMMRRAGLPEDRFARMIRDRGLLGQASSIAPSRRTTTQEEPVA